MQGSNRVLTSSVLAAIVAALLSACQVPVAMQAPAPTPTLTPVVPYGDGVLRIGGLVPTTGGSAVLSAAQVAGIELAVREIDESGGVGGAPVQVFHRDVGEPGGGVLAASFAELVAKGVDVVVGPSDSALAAQLVPLAAAARIPIISQDALAAGADTIDSAGYLFRPAVGPDVLAASVLEIAGESRLAVLGVDDGFGGAVVSAVEAERADGGSDPAPSALLTPESISGGASTSAITKAIKGDPEVVAIAASAASVESAATLIQALLERGVEASQLLLVFDRTSDLAGSPVAGALAGARAVVGAAVVDDAFRARILSADPGVTDFRFAAESYDAVMLAALAATFAGDDGGESIARAIPAVTRGSVPCSTYAECIEVLRTEPSVDYLGVTGVAGLSDAGEASASSVSVWQYGADGRATKTGTVLSASQL